MDQYEFDRMTAGHKAWLDEYGYIPESPEEKAEYKAFRFGFDRGVRAGYDLRGDKMREYLNGAHGRP